MARIFRFTVDRADVHKSVFGIDLLFLVTNNPDFFKRESKAKGITKICKRGRSDGSECFKYPSVTRGGISERLEHISSYS